MSYPCYMPASQLLKSNHPRKPCFFFFLKFILGNLCYVCVLMLIVLSIQQPYIPFAPLGSSHLDERIPSNADVAWKFTIVEGRKITL